MKNKLAHLVKVGACALGLVVLLSSGAANAAPPAATANPVSTSAVPKPDAVISSVAPAASTAKAPESAANPYGLESLWGTSDAVAKVVLLLLLIMSVGSWYIMVVKVLEQAKMGRQAKAAAKDFWTAGTVQQGAAALEANSAFRFVADAATNALKKHEGLMGHIPLNDWISMGIQAAWPFSQRSVPSPRLWASLAPSGASTTP